MGNQDDFDPRLEAYLHRGANTPPPVGMEARILGSPARVKVGWVLQVAAAAAVLVLAIGLGIIFQRGRQSSADHPVPPVATPTTKPTPYPTPTATGAPYPLIPPASSRMINASTGWAAGSGTNRILRTTDGGSHWVDVTPSAAKAGTWITYFLDANHAWLASSLGAGSGSDFSVTIYRTADGGHTWQQAGRVAPDLGWPGSMDFVDSNDGWLFVNQGAAAGSQGVTFYGTVDGGTTWTKLSETDSNDPTGNAGHLPFGCDKGVPVFVNSATGFIPGACGAGPTGPFFYVTRDGAKTWNTVRISLPVGYGGNCLCEVNSLRFADSRNGVFVLNLYGPDGLPHNFLYATHDAGNSWQDGALLPTNCYTAYFIDATIGWTLDAKKNAVLQTNDGGLHWSTLGTVPSSQVVMDLQFVSATIGWAMGSEPAGNTLIKTSDGGRTWTTQLSP